MVNGFLLGFLYEKTKTKSKKLILSILALPVQKCYDLKNKLRCCKECNVDCYGEEEQRKHELEVHTPQNAVKWENNLDWLVILPGADHIRLNVAKAIIATYWDAYFKQIAVELGYSFPSALMVAKNGSDLHKSDQMVSLMMEAGAQSLGRLYMENKGSSIDDISIDEFLIFFDE